MEKQTSFSKRIFSIMLSLLMVLSMLLYFPGGIFSSLDWGLTTSAEGEKSVTFTAIAGTAGASDNESYASLIDGKCTESDFSKWCITGFTSVADGGDGAYIIFSASEPISVTGYSIVTGNDNAEWIDRNPKSWTLYGGNGSVSDSWVVIDSIENDTNLEDKNYASYPYDVNSATTTWYQYFKLEITATQGADVMQMSEFILNYDTCDHNWEDTGTTIEPTCTEGGYDIYECAKCHWQKKVPDGTLASDHNFVDGVCTRCGVADTTEPSVDNGVYQIGTAGELYWFAGLVNGDASVCDYNEESNPNGTKQNTSANAVLTADITVNRNLLTLLEYDIVGNVTNGTRFTSWTPIGNSFNNAYTGTFDGKNHTISGLYFNDTSTSYVGLFGYVRVGGSVSNVGVEDSYFKGNDYVGGVCGFYSGDRLTNCYNTGTVSGSSYVGGVCGESFSIPITNCYHTGAVSGSSVVGGVCGFNNGGRLANCYSTGEVTATGVDAYVGGVCGRSGGTITNCYYDSTVYSGNAVGYNSGTVSENVLGKTTAKFNSGEVAYLLSQGCTIYDTTYDGSIWGQDLSTTDSYPVLGGATVYTAENCTGYSNQATETEYHNYRNGVCTRCGVADTTPKEPSVDNGVYQIGTAGELYWFAGLVNGDASVCDYNEESNPNGTKQNTSANAVLTADITVNRNLLTLLEYDIVGNVTNGTRFTSWTPIGNSFNNAYTGTFDGKNHTISGLYFNDTSTSYVGLFGYVRVGGSVSNVGVEDSYFKGNDYVGGVCGFYSGDRLTNCYNTGTVSGSSYVGGVCGESFSIPITNCYHTGAVSGSSVVGGVCGFNNGGRLANCYSTGEVTATGVDAYVGGVCGRSGGTITNCYYDSTVYSGNAVGYNSGTVSENVLGKTTAKFNSGEVAYLLSQGCTIYDTTYDGSIWGQDLSTTDSYPVLGGATVYTAENCTGYSNTENDTKKHNYQNGKCIWCGKLDPQLANKDYPTEVGYTGEALAPTAKNFTYSGEGELTFTWYAGDTELETAPTDAGKYTLVVAIAETEEYAAESITIDVEIIKGTPVYTVPVATATYGQTLKDVDLPDGFTWQDEETTSVGNAGEHTFQVTFTPTDTENYNVVEDIEVTIEVAKANPTVTPTIEDKTYSEGDEIPEISTGENDTPGTIKWLDVLLETLEAGENTLTWEFTPTDADNYNVVTGTMIVVADPKTILYGDVNMNGTVDLIDAITINKHLANIVQLSDAQEANADCYQDGTIDDKDANALMGYVILLIERLPIQE